MLRFLIIYITLLLAIYTKGYAQQADTPKVYSLLIGLNKMGEIVNDQLPMGEEAISGAGVDIERMKLLLKNISAEPPITLFNEMATKKNMEDSLNYRFGNMKSSDVFIVYFTGHGIPLRDWPYAPLLKGEKEEDGHDEALVLYDNLVTDDELQYWTCKFTKGLLIFIVDACYSGTMLFDKSSDVYKKSKKKKYDKPEDALIPFLIFGKKTYYLPWVPDSLIGDTNIVEARDTTLPNMADNFYSSKKLDTLNILFYSATSEDKSAYGDASGGIFTYLLVYVYLKLIEENQEFGAFINYKKYAEIINKKAAGIADMEPQFMPSDTLKNLKYVETHFPFKFR